MRSKTLAALGLALLGLTTGCAMGISSQDATFPAYGGKWQRADPCCGRVGSLFQPAEAMQAEGIVTDDQQPGEGELDELPGSSIMMPGGSSESESLSLPEPDGDGASDDDVPVPLIN